MRVQTPEELRDFLLACRDSHVPFAEGRVAPDLRGPEDVDYGPDGGEQAFHKMCVREYDEALEVLDRLLSE